MDLREKLFGSSGLGDARVELRESSGPVSPRFQYELHVVAWAEGGVLRFRRDDVGQYQGGVPARDRHVEGELSAEAWRALWEALLRAGPQALGADHIGAERRGRVGVSYNTLTLTVPGEPEVRCEYLLSLLEDSSPATEPVRAALAAVKALGA